MSKCTCKGDMDSVNFVLCQECQLNLIGRYVYPSLCKNDIGQYYVFEIYCSNENKAKEALGASSHHFVCLLADKGIKLPRGYE